MNPAALTALLSGDMDNFLTAATPGGIEAQEAAGQAALVASSRLPKDMRDPREKVTKATGIVFGKDADDLFVNVTLPAGWKLKPTEHSMWSDLIDANGFKRAGVFYKAAFYDRNAHMNWDCRYRIECDYAKPTSTFKVIDRTTGQPIHTAGQYPYGNYELQSVVEKEAVAWLTANYPDHNDPFAYWAA